MMNSKRFKISIEIKIGSKIKPNYPRLFFF